jgi:hypothetical protein
MAERDLIVAISKRLRSMPLRKRTAMVRQWASESSADERFIEKLLPDLYREAFRSSSSVRTSPGVKGGQRSHA